MVNTEDNLSVQSDETLVNYSKRGNDLAFQELMRRYIDAIYNFTRQYAKNPEDTEDITQDTFFKAWKNIDKFEDGRNFKPWLYTIARNTALDFIKRRHVSSFSDFDDVENDLAYADNVIDPEPLPDQIFERGQIAAVLENSMDDIHPDHRAVILMHYHHDMTFEEIADSLNKPMNTVKSWHRRALMRMKNKLVHQEHKLGRKE